jgi:Amt family ammonium transporter
LILLTAFALVGAATAWAEEAADPLAWEAMSVDEKLDALKASALQLDDDGKVASGNIYGDSDTLWTCLAAFLVFFMQAGFAMVEAGFTRAKNACNIIMKNLMDFSIGTLSFWMIGFGLMFGVTYKGWFGTSDFFFDGGSSGFNWAFLIFQTVFCATAATIVSGAMAERTKYSSYLIYTVAITVIVYPIFGSWAWGSLFSGSGWLEGLGFTDFAGSTVVHSIGGWCALAGAIVLGPRLGKYGKNGKVTPIPGHNIPMAALGVFILWLGWFGFNPGSTTMIGNGEFALVAVNTNLAAAAGAIAAMIASWILFKKPDTSFALNGALAGLVAITAGCYNLSPAMSTLTGLIAGPLCVVSVVFFDKIRVDDPVGAISVHGVCGAWGTLATGLFAADVAIGVQLVGIAAAFLWAFPVSMAVFLSIKYTVGLRVSAEEEMEGLDITEHGIYAYPPSFVAGVADTAGTLAPGVAPAAFAKTATEGA